MDAWARRAAACALLACHAAAPVAAAELVCAGGGVHLSGGEPALLERLCSAAEAAEPLLEACGLPQGGLLEARLVDRLPGIGATGRCLALYDCRAEEIRILTPEAIERELDPDHPLRADGTEALAGSLLVHEIAHARMADLPPPGGTDRTLQEYVAYALQIASLAPEARARLVAAYPRSRPVTAREIDDDVHALAPLAFAVNAWLHFAAEADGCGFVRGLFDGTSRLGPAAP